MKRILLLLFVTCTLASQAQVYNNEWIDYNKTYYKFKVGTSGVYRISQTTLTSMGIGSIPAEQFQLWRNGEEVRLYTSVNSGPLGAGGFIEFWGEMNDGKPDSVLYLEQGFQLSNTWSLQTDTAALFLTVNPSGSNLRFETVTNNVAGNSLPAEPYFMHTIGTSFKQKMNQGYAHQVSEFVYSSAYDKGEGWTSFDIDTTGIMHMDHADLHLYNTGPEATFSVSASGNALYLRRIGITLNGAVIDTSTNMDYFNTLVANYPVPLSVLTPNYANFTFDNITTSRFDYMVIHKYSLTYPRQFNFASQKNFYFELPANTNGNYLEISAFNYGSTAPILYDITNGKRYVGNTTNPALVRFALEPSSEHRKLRLVSNDASNINGVTNLQTRNFTNFANATLQGDYIIITHPALFSGPGGTDPVEEYRQYRSSVEGGGYNAKLYLIDELVDQFGLGIKKHPNSIRNFLSWARANFAVQPKYVFLMGKGLNYIQHRLNESHADVERLALVPSFGQPASDILLSSPHGTAIPSTPIGRLSAINGGEVALYLKKVKDYEAAQKVSSPLIADKAWMKNVIHIIGVGDPETANTLRIYMEKYKAIITDTLFGANVHMFNKSSADALPEQLASQQLEHLFAEGVSLVTYFGHSSATTLEYNLDDPNNYDNHGKYPLFLTLGCNAGNFFNFNTLRLIAKETLSEKFVFAQDKGSIGFIASTHFGIAHYLDLYNTKTYTAIGRTKYHNTVGEVMQEAINQVFLTAGVNDYYARFHCEQTTLHGDPAIRVNAHAKPDYVIEDPLVKVSPSFITVGDLNFKLDAKFLNMGKAYSKEVVVEVKRRYPNNVEEVIYRDTIPGIRYADSISLTIPIVGNRDKGVNRLTVTIDADNAVDELYETNNSVSKDIVIYEDEARTVYPYNFAIINKQNINLVASTANPFATLKDYMFEIDTTEFFNSPAKVVRTVSSYGGLIETTPGITFTDSTVYYWRVAPVPTSGAPIWHTASFVYLPNSDLGFNQSHFYQHTKSQNTRMELDSASRKWDFGQIANILFLRLGTYVSSGAVQEAALSVTINGVNAIRVTCWFQSLQFNVFHPITFKPWRNQVVREAVSFPNDLGDGLFGSHSPRNFAQPLPLPFNFEFRYTTPALRMKAMNFMRDSIPDGHFVVVRNFSLSPTIFGDPIGFPQVFINDWIADEATNGAGQTLYHYLKNAGFSGIDSFYKVRCWGFVYKKNDPSFTPQWIVSENEFDNPTLSVECFTPDSIGTMTSPVFGPAKAWKMMKWNGLTADATPGDHPRIHVIGVTNIGVEDTIYRNIDISQPEFDISGINPVNYPYVKLGMTNQDSIHFTPYNLRYWRITYDPVPEGAVAPNLFFQMKDTADVGEPIDFKFAFKNVSEADFDSLKVKLLITNKNNVQVPVDVPRHDVLIKGDTIHVKHEINTRQFPGLNNMYVEVNPDNDQPEQYHFNNFIFKSFYTRPDSLNPILDVTFDGVHILNRDIVNPKPHIVIKLKDEAKWMVLDDTSTVTVRIIYPNGDDRFFNFDGDTLKFTPPATAPSNDNTATVDFLPYFTEDGEYTLEVMGRDMSNNGAGRMQYRVAFQVINKPMISNMLNYPNPFTTSTAFVFTITGSEVPQNIRIQIMTVTGKIVREITKDELGPLRIGRNITEFKWDGTDQYGQRLANGVYLYRVITNHHGKSLDKYRSTEEFNEDNTEKYFNKGYGKMYLMR